MFAWFSSFFNDKEAFLGVVRYLAQGAGVFLTAVDPAAYGLYGAAIVALANFIRAPKG